MEFLKSFVPKILSNRARKKIAFWSNHPIETQQKVLQNLIKNAQHTAFGKEHHFGEIVSYELFKKNVPIRSYEDLKPYIERIKQGESNVLWKGKPLYFAKTSGTTSGTKYIPISKESMPTHIESAKNALLCYLYQSKNASFVNGKMIFLQGSPTLQEKNGIKIGRLSGIVAHFVPSYLQKNRMPSWETNCIEDWEKKVETIVQETQNQNMTLISGIPPWLQMYFEKLIAQNNKPVGELFKNLQLIVTGGVNYEPYREKMNQLLGREIQIIQTYPASEGFIAFQDELNNEALLLLLDNGIFYEFIPVEEVFNENPTRFSIGEIELEKEYAIILNTNAGLWGYSIGDTVRFVSKNPYRILVTGRTKHFTSAFGEHVIAIEVEKALKNTIENHFCIVSEFSVAPQVNPSEGLPHHEWFIEFESLPKNLSEFSSELDHQLRKLNSYYNDLIAGNILRPLVISTIKKAGFQQYMKSQGKLGGQNKLPRLSNDRNIAEKLSELDLIEN